jgi:translation initiation factor IF-3
LIGSNGEQVGIVDYRDAKRQAQDEELDLVVVSPGTRPPVYKIMDKGKLQYDKKKKQKKHKGQELKEIKLSPRIGEGDFLRKSNETRKFLEQNKKVKVSLMFKGREISHREIGEAIVNRFIEGIEDIGVIDKAPSMNGRQIIAIVSPR